LASIDREGYWEEAKEGYRNAYRMDARRVLAAADAVGAVGVSEATIRVCFAEIETLAINSVQEWSAPDPVVGRRLNASEKIKRLNAAKERWVALLTNQPAASTSDGATGGEEA